ncbi:MAG TPA: copper ion binding protein [Acidimicrobiia bacterium]|jgi:copper chaperone|nr:copper ion binding protein [Acidimicrobiia bacterium]
MNQVTLNVPDISCGHCKSSIEGAVAPMDGVASAEVTIDARTVAVTYDESAVDLDAIITAIEDQGYDVAR